MKIYIKDKLINLDLLRDLKNNYQVVYKDDSNIRLKLHNNILTVDYIEIDCSSWIEKIEQGNTNISLSSLIDTILIEFNNSENLTM